MKEYVISLLKRISQFSDELDNTALFIDKPWVFIDSNSDNHKYIFKKNGELIMSKNGKVQIGKWEYMSAAKALLIDRIEDKVLLNQAFFNQSVMLLRIDGTKDEILPLVNELDLPDLDYIRYLENIKNKKDNILIGKLEDGKQIDIFVGEGNTAPGVGMKVTIERGVPENGKYKSAKTKKLYEIVNGEIVNIFFTRNYKTTNGKMITVEQSNEHQILTGDLAFEDGDSAEDGKYKFGMFDSIRVKNGRVV